MCGPDDYPGRGVPPHHRLLRLAGEAHPEPARGVACIGIARRGRLAARPATGAARPATGAARPATLAAAREDDDGHDAHEKQPACGCSHPDRDAAGLRLLVLFFLPRAVVFVLVVG